MSGGWGEGKGGFVEFLKKKKKKIYRGPSVQEYTSQKYYFLECQEKTWESCPIIFDGVVSGRATADQESHTLRINGGRLRICSFPSSSLHLISQ